MVRNITRMWKEKITQRVNCEEAEQNRSLKILEVGKSCVSNIIKRNNNLHNKLKRNNFSINIIIGIIIPHRAMVCFITLLVVHHITSLPDRNDLM